MSFKVGFKDFTNEIPWEALENGEGTVATDCNTWS